MIPARRGVGLVVEGRVATLVLDRPDRHNALDVAFLAELESAIAEARALGESGAARVLLLTSSSERAFSTGADLEQLRTFDAEGLARFAAAGLRVVEALESAPLPTVAAVGGLALGGGWELALACDLVYASERAAFGLPEARLGLIPGFGGVARLTALVGPMRARELVYTARTLRALAARDLGLVLEVLPPAELLAYCRSVAARMAAMSPASLAEIKRAVHRTAAHGVPSVGEELEDAARWAAALRAPRS
jgi:enoyl-CoA hydratase